jgi:hypothetical protein
MTVFTRHIATFLLAVFLVPAGYQSIHVLQHHTDIPCRNQCDSKHHSEETGHRNDSENPMALEQAIWQNLSGKPDIHCDSEHPANPVESSEKYSIPVQERKHCPIVDFRFAIKDLPQLASLLSSPISAEILPDHQLTGHFIATFFSQRNPRAPPRSLTS